ncbi:DALR anticodon-binding domain-containing protein 3 [Papilio machaon]|uniref:DALR anticodon-binding domain-containing protein 3 n=1 Tax=Papilio machaon TaxID=76193 RepID=A0A194REE7_PAPMA|nr:DALR anticodon-binding domain-containing protein 3 [Papilio machaon]
MNDLLKEFTRNLNNFLIGRDGDEKVTLIKKHSSNLQAIGEFSFPNTITAWHEYVNEKADLNNSNFLTYVKKDAADIINASKKWKLSVKNVKFINDRVHLFVDRRIAIRVCLECCLENNNWIIQKLNDKQNVACIDPSCDGAGITSLRVKSLVHAINNLVAINSSNLSETTRVVVTSKSSNSCGSGQYLLCGAVLNAKTNVKENALSGDDFIKLRQNELMLIAQHKYGMRAGTEDKWREFIAHLGQSAVTFELLQTQPSSAVKINFDVSTGCSKGAAFILYNCARLETIIRTFNEKVVDGTYPPLPQITNTDFSLLTQEEEWALVLTYAAGAAGALAGCGTGPHRLCAFLSAMARLLSQYYRKTRILTEPRSHLLPVMFARIHMLKVLNETLKTCLRILNIKSVSQMYHSFLLLSFYIIVTLTHK